MCLFSPSVCSPPAEFRFTLALFEVLSKMLFLLQGGGWSHFMHSGSLKFHLFWCISLLPLFGHVVVTFKVNFAMAYMPSSFLFAYLIPSTFLLP